MLLLGVHALAGVARSSRTRDPSPYPHQRPLTRGPSPEAPHQRPLTRDPSPEAPHQRPLTRGPSPEAHHQRPLTRGPSPEAHQLDSQPQRSSARSGYFFSRCTRRDRRALEWIGFRQTCSKAPQTIRLQSIWCDPPLSLARDEGAPKPATAVPAASCTSIATNPTTWSTAKEW